MCRDEISRDEKQESQPRPTVVHRWLRRVVTFRLDVAYHSRFRAEFRVYPAARAARRKRVTSRDIPASRRGTTRGNVRVIHHAAPRSSIMTTLFDGEHVAIVAAFVSALREDKCFDDFHRATI